MSQVTSSVGFQEVLADLDGRGRGFEELSAWFLLNDPEWSARITKVWRWDDWPGRWGPDRGIDLVAETTDGELIAVQCKHYHPVHAITKAEVDSFLSESNRPQFTERVLISTTRNLATGARQVIEAQEKPVSLLLRDRLESADVDWAAFAANDVNPLQRKSPKPHQERAVAAVVRAFEHDKRGQLLMPCGTGKTLTSLWIAERLQAQRVLVLLPTLALLRQTVQVWRAQAAEPFGLLKVCSETGDPDDEIAAADLTPSEVGGPVSTDPTRIAAFLDKTGRRVIFSTYKSSPRLAQALAELPGARFDLVLADEGHHCAGPQAGPHKTVLDDSKIPAARRLFITATPTVFAPSAKEQAANAHTPVASMDDRALFGGVLHRLSFKQAVAEGLLCRYQVVVMPVDDVDVAELVRRRTLVTPDGGDHVTDAYNLAAQIACLRTMRRFNCRRMVAFHPLVEPSQNFAADIRLAAELLDQNERPAEVHAAHVDGYMSRPRRDQVLDRFKAEDDVSQLLSNVRLLAEGVDVRGIDAICLVDTHRSSSAIVQAVGRVVRTAPGKDVGTVLLPVLVEEGQTVDEALRTSDHRPVLEVLAALRSIDTEIRHTIDTVRVELGPRLPRRPGPSRWVVDAPTEVDEKFAESVEVCLVDLLNAQSSKSTGPIQREPVQEPIAPYSLDWTDPEQTIKIGLEHAKAYRHQHPLGAIERYGSYRGFPIGDWWKAVLRRWDKGRLSDQTKRECAGIFNWLAVSPKRHPLARRELAQLDPHELAERIDDWLDALEPGENQDIEELARGGAIGSGGLPAETVLEVIPTDLPVEDRVRLALEMLRVGGQALYDGLYDSGVFRGFSDALVQPGRGHDLDVRLQPGRPPHGDLECYAFGWEAGQRALRVLPQRGRSEDQGDGRRARRRRPRRGRRP